MFSRCLEPFRAEFSAARWLQPATLLQPVRSPRPRATYEKTIGLVFLIAASSLMCVRAAQADGDLSQVNHVIVAMQGSC